MSATSATYHGPERTLITRLRRRGVRNLVLVAGLAIFAAWTLFPFLWIIATSLKPNKDIYTAVSIIPKRVTFQHYVDVIRHTDFLIYFRNSLLVATGTTVIAMIIAVLAAYAMTRLSFFGRAFMARATIVTYLVPPALLFIPLFQIAIQLHLTNKAVGLIVIYLIFTVPFSTWLTISYFNTVPSDLEDAALVDGANRLQALISVFIPLALPALAVVALFTFTQAWNEFLFALLLIGRDSQKTVPVGLADFVKGDVFQWGPLMAGSLLAALPPVLIYIVAQKWVVSGLAGGAIKG
ncbi:MAG TPA: carbohydrate ABC transporter permease [Thermomicrobiales bacterium]|nr:carbohydrate ABC transporter permease [Thermomicrobiales bacterium]